MTWIDPQHWSAFAQGVLVGGLAVLGIQTAWRARPRRDDWWRWVPSDDQADQPPGVRNIRPVPPRRVDDDVRWERDA